MRAKGKVLWNDSLTLHPVVAEAKAREKQRQQQRFLRREKFVLLNKHRYPNLYEKWLADGKGKQPKCSVCREAALYWNEPAHVCEGYKPQFVERTEEEWEERRKDFLERRKVRWEEQREMIREAKANGEFYDDCEDGPEYDYCEEDDDCEDDGDPMWE
jgi:hypothetical protein